ncbi:MAG: 50S ribosomal protein L24 [Chloroflexi bacterium]|nr:50S ribosomal protein L24 [Chloroflexota bacterium]MBI3763940.1 50S ribosomal protein L24 [Chloroflexota bacterium]
MDIKRGDTVKVVAGNDRGKQGEVLRVIPETNRVVVQSVNIRKKHQKQAQTQARQGQIKPGIIQFDAPLSASNVMLVCPHCHEAVRVGHQRDADTGRSHRVCRNCQSLID